MARIICDNTDDVDSIQKFAFQMPTDNVNKVVSCNDDSIASVDLTKFKEEGSSKWTI